MKARAQLVVDTADLADELLTRYRTSERVTRRPDRGPKVIERHNVTGDGLLVQLQQAAGVRPAVPKPTPLGYDRRLGYRAYVPAGSLVEASELRGAAGEEFTSHTKPGSRPLTSNAFIVLADLTAAAADLVARTRLTAHLKPKPSRGLLADVEKLRSLLILTRPDGEPAVPESQVRRINSAFRGWASAARIALDYEAPIATLEAICPDCSGELRVRSDATSDVWCAGRKAVVHGPAVNGGKWPVEEWLGCGAKWPRITWVQLLEQIVEGPALDNQPWPVTYPRSEWVAMLEELDAKDLAARAAG